MRLKGKYALVTGGSRGIGRACAVALAKEGATVAVNYNTTAPGETLRLVNEAGGQAVAFQADMGDTDQIDRLFAQTVERFGRLDIYVNNANAGARTRDPRRDFLNVSDDALFQGYWLPYRACYRGGQNAARRMVEQGDGGAIVNITSVHQHMAGRPIRSTAQ